jgi:geranylgeranyl diphosphate synthase type II
MNIANYLFTSFETYFSTINFKKEPENLYQPISYFLQIGGKKLRPYALLLAAYSKNNHIEDALPAAAAIELFHNFSLVHDDIMDKAVLRRGFDTIHEKYSTNTAILSGDALLLQAYHQLLLTPENKWPQILTIFNKTATEVCEGQQMDMDFEQKSYISEAEYIQMIGLKTSVLIAAAMQIGAIIGGANGEDAQNYYNFAYHLGVAFQIQDDILDCFGKEEIIGKKNGGDILNNKKTILTIYTLSANETYKHTLMGHYNSDIEKINTIKYLYETSGAYAYALSLRNDLLKKGLHYLELLQLKENIRTYFEQLVNQLIIREF